MSTLNRALEIARETHAGQVDKAGRPYIEHVLRVVDAVEGDDAKIVAALHDVLEDGAYRDAINLTLRGIPHHLAQHVAALSRWLSTPYAEYIATIGRIGGIPLAVKIADLRDNSDPARLALLPEKDRARLSKKYAAALVTLGATTLPVADGYREETAP